MPIIWLISLIVVCPIHNYPLVKNCCECGSSLRISVKPFKIGYCPKCQTWLGYSGSSQSNLSQSQNLPYFFNYYPLTQQYVIENVSDLIATNYPLNYYLSPNIIANNFKFFLAGSGGSVRKKMSDFSRRQFARESYLNFETLNSCITKRSIPTLITLLRITYRFKLSVIDFRRCIIKR